MHEVRIGYRFKNGDVAGFIGEGDTKDEAEKSAFTQLRQKLNRLSEEIDTSRVIRRREQATAEEMAVIEDDWKFGGLDELDDHGHIRHLHGPTNKTTCEVEKLYYVNGGGDA